MSEVQIDEGDELVTQHPLPDEKTSTELRREFGAFAWRINQIRLARMTMIRTLHAPVEEGGHGLSFRQMGALLGVSPTHLRELHRGEKGPRAGGSGPARWLGKVDN